MSFTIFSLGLTAGLAALAASIPIIIHLLHRQRTQPILWGAMQFLKESPLQQRRRKKVDHWLLMLLRIAVAVLVVLFVGWPKAERKAALLGEGGGTDIAVVIDRSLSTGRHSGNSTVFQQSVENLEQLAKSPSLRATDTVSVVLAEHTPRKITDRPFPPGGVVKIVGDLKKMKPGTSDASIPDAVRVARELLSHGRNARKMVLVMSDRQRTGWKVDDLRAWNAALGQRPKGVEPDVRVYEVPVQPELDAANVTVAGLSVKPTLIGTARPAEITASVANRSGKDVPAQTAKLFVNGKQVAQQDVPPLAAGQSRDLRKFEFTFAEAGSHWVEVRIDADDSLAADNSSVAAAFVWQSLPVLVIDSKFTNIGPDSSMSQATLDQFPGSKYLLPAMMSDAASVEAPPLVKPTVISIADRRLNDARDDSFKLEDYAVVVLNDVPQLPTALQNKLADYARSGHGVWVILGRNTERGFIKDGLAQAGLMSLDLKDEQSAPDKPPALVVRDENSPMLDLLATPERNVFTSAQTYKWWSVRAREADAKVVLAADGSGDPLILDRAMGSNGGRVVVWATGVDKSWNNWPTAGVSFPPLVNLTLYHLAAGTTKGMENRQLRAGEPIMWTGPGTPTVSKVTVTRPDGTKVERKPVTRDSRQILSDPETFLPGKYELAFDKSEITQPVYYGVGIDRSELDAAPLADSDLQWLSNEDHKFVQATLDTTRGVSLTESLFGQVEDTSRNWLLAMALGVIAFLLGETVLTFFMIRRQTKPGAEQVMGGVPV